MKKFPPVHTLFLAACLSLTAACNQQENETTETAAEAEQPTTNLPEGQLIQDEPKKSYKLQVETLCNSMEDMRYSKDTIRVNANAQVTIELLNRADDPAMVHNIVFVQNNRLEEVAQAGMRAGAEEAFVPDHPAVFGGSELVGPGESTEFTFTAPFQSGEYDFGCTYPDHWQEMNGTFIVEAVAE
jgi:azurin